MLTIKRFTALGRPIHPGYPTSKLISILTLLALAILFVFQLYQDLPALQALFAAAAGALAFFFTWAFGREIDPAYDWSAFAALPFAFAAALTVGAPSLLPLLFLLLLSRAINRSSGLKPTIFDHLLLLALAAIITFDGSPAALLLYAAASFYSAISSALERIAAIFGATAALAFLANALFRQPGFFNLDYLSATSVLLIIALFFAVLIIALLTKTASAVDDENLAPLSSSRINMCRLLLFLYLATELISVGTAAFDSYYPLMLAYFAAALFHSGRAAFKARK